MLFDIIILKKFKVSLYKRCLNSQTLQHLVHLILEIIKFLNVLLEYWENLYILLTNKILRYTLIYLNVCFHIHIIYVS